MSEQPRRCAGFVRSPAHEEMWTPCLDEALPRDTLCRSHREGLDGALLSLANFENSPGFTHVSQTKRLSKTARARKFGRRRTRIDAESALVEGVPHVEIMLQEVIESRRDPATERARRKTHRVKRERQHEEGSGASRKEIPEEAVEDVRKEAREENHECSACTDHRGEPLDKNIHEEECRSSVWRGEEKTCDNAQEPVVAWRRSEKSAQLQTHEAGRRLP